MFLQAIVRENTNPLPGTCFPEGFGFEWLEEPLKVGAFVPPPKRGQLGCFIQDPSQVHREPYNGKGIKNSCLAHFPQGKMKPSICKHQTLSNVRTGVNATLGRLLKYVTALCPVGAKNICYARVGSFSPRGKWSATRVLGTHSTPRLPIFLHYFGALASTYRTSSLFLAGFTIFIIIKSACFHCSHFF